MNYEIIDCWLIFDTDVEGNKGRNLIKVTCDKEEVGKQSRNGYRYIEDARAILITGSTEAFVLRYESAINNLGTEVKSRLRDQALAKLTVDEISAIKEMGFK